MPGYVHSGATPRGRVFSDAAIVEYDEAARANATSCLDRMVCVGALGDLLIEEQLAVFVGSWDYRRHRQGQIVSEPQTRLARLDTTCSKKKIIEMMY